MLLCANRGACKLVVNEIIEYNLYCISQLRLMTAEKQQYLAIGNSSQLPASSNCLIIIGKIKHQLSQLEKILNIGLLHTAI